jgi:hypothetical protein
LVRLLAFTAVLAALPSLAVACRLALILALDVSSSVDEVEHALQRGGTAEALIAEEVQAAFFASPDPVALAIFEWSGRYNQVQILDWTMINEPADLWDAAAVVRRAERSHDDFPTAIGHALGHASIRMKEAPICLEQTIDLAGDGPNNEGFGPREAYAAFPFDGVTVNGLVIHADNAQNSADVLPFYRNEIIRGPGSFVEEAFGFEDYSRALERKLVRELTTFAIGGIDQIGLDQG